MSVPAAIVEHGATWGQLEGRGWPAVVGRRLGDHSVLIHVWCQGVHPGERVTDVVRLSGTQPAGLPSGWSAADQLAPHGAVFIEHSGRLIQAWSNPGTVVGEVVHQDAAERVTRFQARFHLRGVPLPIWWRSYVYQLAGSPAARWDYQVLMSDASDSRLEFDVAHTRLRTAAYHRVDHAERLGVGGSRRDINGNQWTQLLGATTYVDGVRPFWTGVSVEFPSTVPAEAWLDQGHEVWAQAAAARAALEGPILGCVGRGVWDGHWLGLGGVGAVPGSQDPWQAAQAVHDQWLALAAQRGGYWDPRPQGMALNPGQTGAQPNHGVVRGSEIVATGCPLPLEGYEYRVTSHMRPVGYYEHDLSRVTRQDRAGWSTWTGRTFVTDGFDDTLSKPISRHQYLKHNVAGWNAPDQQHYGHLELMSWYALAGRFVARDLIGDLVEVWLAAHDEYAGRAIGRTWLDMAAAYRLTGDQRITGKITRMAEGMAGWEDRIGGPIKCWPRFTDPRALVDANGNPVECGVAWQIGLMVPGLVAADRVQPNPVIARMAQLNVAALIEAAWWQDGDGRWRCVDYWAFRDGARTTPADYGVDGKVPGRTWSTGWFYDWTRFATEQGIGAKAQAIQAQRYSGVGSDWTSTQWAVR